MMMLIAILFLGAAVAVEGRRRHRKRRADEFVSRIGRYGYLPL